MPVLLLCLPLLLSAQPDVDSVEKARRLLQRAQQALGGAERLAAVKDFTSVAQVEFQSAGAVMKATQTNRWIAPSHFRQDVALPFGKISSYFDGQAGWISGPQGTGPMPAPVLKQAEGETFRAFFRLLVSDRVADRTVNLAGPDVVEISDKQGNAVRLQMDPKTGLPVKQSYQSVGEPPSQVEAVYDEWMEVDGIRAPRKITINRAGARFGATTFQEFKLNGGLKVEEISKQP
jgi:hypothetical protein